MLSFLPIARRPIALTAYRRGSRGYGVLHAAPPRQYPGPGPITSSLMSIAGAAIVTWTFYKVIWDYRPTAKAVEPQLLPNPTQELDEDYLQSLEWCIMYD
ncbi:hypothetical protein C8R41DRAFT_982627 [Lentinula lateritia]|uniref:Uncharacterized protein n=1 Tax=Lentinula lateritia TaxID=40482 RepID=A0ABQ8V9T2_9AGAR|nr:hypothetical protein C8R41DRAFT_982627 [Lentinula lateritia]